MLAQKVARVIPEKCRDKSHTIVNAHFARGFVTDFRTEFGVKNFSMGQIFKKLAKNFESTNGLNKKALS